MATDRFPQRHEVDPAVAPEQSLHPVLVAIDHDVARTGDRHHVGTEVSQEHPGERSRTVAVELDHFQAGKRTRHGAR